jgi:autophagy-related protein 9
MVQVEYSLLSDTSSADEPDPMFMYAQKKENIDMSDSFFQRIYSYHQKKGFYCIVLGQLCYILTVLFSISFSSFITICVNWKSINSETESLKDAIYPKCYPPEGHNFLTVSFFMIFFIFWIVIVVYSIYYIYSMIEIRDFYVDQLGIFDNNLKNIKWESVVDKINEKIPFIDMHYVTNKIMRYDNYLISMINQDVLGIDEISFGVTFTKILEWNLHKCIIASLFTKGVLMRNVMFSKYLHEYEKRLDKIFKIVGILNIIFAPFVITALAVYFIYKYASEYHKNPKSLGIYSFTPLTKWKIRDFNELKHVNVERLNKAHPIVLKYLSQFISEPFNIILKFLSFIIGSMLIILAIVSFFNSDMIVSLFLIEQPIVFYLGILSAFYVNISNNTIDENENSPDPDETYNELVDVLHYVPELWEHLNRQERYTELKKLFKLQWLNFLNELLSIIYVPFVFIFWLPKRSRKIVKFFQENSVYVDKLDIICCNSLFKQNLRFKVSPGGGIENSQVIQKKMTQSINNFGERYPNWNNNLESFQQSQVIFQHNQEDYDENIDLESNTSSNTITQRYYSSEEPPDGLGKSSCSI